MNLRYESKRQTVEGTQTISNSSVVLMPLLGGQSVPEGSRNPVVCV